MTGVSYIKEVEVHEQPPTIALLELRKSCWMVQIYDNDPQWKSSVSQKSKYLEKRSNEE